MEQKQSGEMGYNERLLSEALSGNKDSLKELEINAGAGDMFAQYCFAQYYLKVSGSDQDDDYLYWMRKATANGYKVGLSEREAQSNPQPQRPEIDEEKKQIIEKLNLHYVTHKPDFFQKLMQVYWFNPKSWLLKELTVKNGVITVSNLKGQQLSAPVVDCFFSYQVDKFGRWEIYVNHGNEKFHFKEMPGMLEDSEWEAIKSFLTDYCILDKTALGQFTDVLGKIAEMRRFFD